MRKIVLLLVCMIVACSFAAVSAEEVKDPNLLTHPTPYSTWSSMYRVLHHDLNPNHPKIAEADIIDKYEQWCASCHFKPDYSI